jgi:hypothetical protein
MLEDCLRRGLKGIQEIIHRIRAFLLEIFLKGLVIKLDIELKGSLIKLFND